MASSLVRHQETLYASRIPTRRWLHQTRRGWIQSALRRIAAERRTATALEVGPGSGVYLPLLCELFDAVTASDVEEEYLRHLGESAAALPNLSLVPDDITASKLPAGGFDLVLCSEVIEHNADPAAVVRGLRELVRPGGVILLSTPQAHSSLELANRIAFLPGIRTLVRGIYRESIVPPGHVGLLTARQARELLEGAGLRILEHEVSGLYLPVIAEFGGAPAVRLQSRLERRIRRSRRRGVLWVQYWIAERPAD
jgi:SAM-dependent methyltransferase